jgi:alpha-galactosidase/6-phospho-beta-glucosidase family protein
LSDSKPLLVSFDYLSVYEYRPKGVEIQSVIIKSCCQQDRTTKRLKPFEVLKGAETIDEEVTKLNDVAAALPRANESKMEETSKVISDSTYHRMCQQDRIKKRLMEQEVVTLLQSFDEMRLEEEERGKEKINEAMMKLNDDIAAARKSEMSIREEASGKIQKLRAEMNLEVQRIVNRKVRTQLVFLFCSYLPVIH